MSDPTKILVIFDLDFTLIDNSFTICKAFEYALDHFKIPPPKKEQIMKKIGIPLKEMFLDYLDETHSEKAIHLFREYYGTHFFEGVKFFPRAIELLEELKSLGYRIALLTSKKTEMAIKFLKYFDLKKYFEYILGEQQEFKPKPDPEPILYILSKFPTINKVYMIGDHVVDCMAARNAKVDFIGVLTGNTTRQELRNCAGKDTIILSKIAELDPSKHLI